MKRDITSRPKQGFVKLMRSPFTTDLLRDPLAFGLLTIIALRARRRQRGLDGLQVGEALIGDHYSYGLTRQEYRSRSAKLEKSGLVAFRKTNRGTIAKLVSTDVFDINESAPEDTKNQPSEQPSTLTTETSAKQPTVQPSNNQPATSQQPLTKNKKNPKNNDMCERTATAPTTTTSSSIPSLEEAENNPLWKPLVRQFKGWCKTPHPKGWLTWVKKQPLPKPKPSCKSNASNGANARYDALLQASQAKHDREAGITR